MIFSFNSYSSNDPDFKIEYICNEKTSSHAAFEVGKNAVVRLKVARSLGVISPSMLLNSDDSSLMISILGEWESTENELDVYTFDLTSLKLDAGLYLYDIRLDLFDKAYYCYCGDKIYTKCQKPESKQFQLTVSNFLYDYPEQFAGGIVYHIFVDRFNRGGKVIRNENQVIIDDWTSGVPEYPEYPGAPLKNTTFYGGTLWGIANKLDYLANLGVTLIYLSPIFESVSNHKYDTADYMTVDLGFGGEDALVFLIQQAKKRGIGIILDGVFNHTGSDSVYFNKYGNYDSSGAYQSKDSIYYSWYHFEDYPDKYTSWWGIDILPRINPEVKECREYFLSDSGVIKKYSALGIAGLRLDVVDELSDSFISGIKEAMSENNPSSLLYGEVWEDASNKVAYNVRKKYYLGNELDGVMNYPIRSGIIEFLRYKNPDKLRYALSRVLHNAPQRIASLQMNLIGSHDTMRILTALGGADPSNYSNSELKNMHMTKDDYNKSTSLLKQAYTILATIPGIPSIYYGDEAGLEGYNDPFNRMPFPWDNIDQNILAHYVKTGKIRRENKVYKYGRFDIQLLDTSTLIFSRTNDTNTLVTVINNSEGTIKLSFDSSVYLYYEEMEYENNHIITIPEHGYEIISANTATEFTLYE